MDFDLFALEEDDDILSCIQLEPTQQQNDNSEYEVIPEFQCSGEDSLANSQFSTEGFIKNGFISHEQGLRQAVTGEITLSAYDFQAVHLRGQSVSQFLFGEACMHLQYLQSSVCGLPLGDTGVVRTYYQQRRQITLLLHLLLHTTHTEQWPLLRVHVDRLRALLNRLTETDAWKLLYFANSCKGNDCNVPAYHLLHGALEWKLLDLCILYKYEWSTATLEQRKSSTAFPLQLARIFEDLLTCSLYLYGKKRSVDLLHSSPFPCTCFKEFWLLLQLAHQKWCATAVAGEEKLDFWSVFNKAMGNLQKNIAILSLTPLGYYEYSNWMLNALTRLHGYRSNGQFEGPLYTRANSAKAENSEFCEQCTRQFLAANPSEEQLRVFICLLTPTLLQWWRPQANVPMLLWEHFHKRFNSSCYIVGAAPSNLAVACASGKAYLDRYRILLQQQPQQLNANHSSYTLFTLLLGKTLERLRNTHANNQAQKLLGRIYTKFSLQKFLTLNETGIHHLIELFLILALCGDSDLGPKLRDKLLSIAFEKVTPNKQIAVAKGHMALLILCAEQHCDLSEYLGKLLQQLQNVRNDLAISKVIADALLDIFVHASNFRNGAYLLIDAWLPHFLNHCTPVEQERTLEALHLIFVQVQRSELYLEANAELLKALNRHILPLLKQQYINNFSHWLPQLAADFCIHCCSVADTQSFQRLFSYFVEAQTANRQAQPQFLLKVLESDKRTIVPATVVMQVWLKSLVLLTAVNEQVVQLSKLVTELPDFHSMTHLDGDELLKAKEPLCVFVAAVGKNYDSCNDYQERCQLADNFNAYLRNFEKWLPPDAKLEKCELTFRFYSFLAIVIYNCPNIVYAKSNISCFFHIAITRFVLPNSVQMGKTPEPKLAQLIHKIWPVLVQGIGRLNFKTDTYINKTLNDLIQKWTPHFKISNNPKVVARPFITCLQGDNQELALFIFEKLSGMFLATQRRQADPNSCLVIAIFQEVISAISNASIEQEANISAAVLPECCLETFMKGTCLLTLEHIMMVDEVVPSRAMLLEHFRHLIGCRVYQDSPRLKELLAEHLRIITKKHLAYYTFFYFELLMKLSQISHELVAQIMDFLLQEVRVVEQKRGAGEDNRIRSCLHKLQQSTDTAKRRST